MIPLKILSLRILGGVGHGASTDRNCGSEVKSSPISYTPPPTLTLDLPNIELDFRKSMLLDDLHRRLSIRRSVEEESSLVAIWTEGVEEDARCDTSQHFDTSDEPDSTPLPPYVNPTDQPGSYFDFDDEKDEEEVSHLRPRRFNPLLLSAIIELADDEEDIVLAQVKDLTRTASTQLSGPSNTTSTYEGDESDFKLSEMWEDENYGPFDLAYTSRNASVATLSRGVEQTEAVTGTSPSEISARESDLVSDSVDEAIHGVSSDSVTSNALHSTRNTSPTSSPNFSPRPAPTPLVTLPATSMPPAQRRPTHIPISSPLFDNMRKIFSGSSSTPSRSSNSSSSTSSYKSSSPSSSSRRLRQVKISSPKLVSTPWDDVPFVDTHVRTAPLPGMGSPGSFSSFEEGSTSSGELSGVDFPEDATAIVGLGISSDESSSCSSSNANDESFPSSPSSTAQLELFDDSDERSSTALESTSPLIWSRPIVAIATRLSTEEYAGGGILDIYHDDDDQEVDEECIWEGSAPSSSSRQGRIFGFTGGVFELEADEEDEEWSRLGFGECRIQV